MSEEVFGGLKPLPKDDRDFEHGRVFGLGVLPKEDFIVAEPIFIEDQKETDFCAAFAGSSVAEDHEGVDLCPIWPFAKICEMRREYRSWGANLREMCKEAVHIGFIEKKDSLFTIDKGRDFLANWENWPEYLDEKAQIHRQRAYFKVEGENLFNAMRAALWMNKKEGCSILTGVAWRSFWTYMDEGIIDRITEDPSTAHALKIFGQKYINNKPFLIGQLSNGKELGNNGLFYFSEKVVNECFNYGAYYFKDFSPEEAKKLCWSWWRRLWEAIKKYINRIFE